MAKNLSFKILHFVQDDRLIRMTNSYIPMTVLFIQDDNFDNALVILSVAKTLSFKILHFVQDDSFDNALVILSMAKNLSFKILHFVQDDRLICFNDCAIRSG